MQEDDPLGSAKLYLRLAEKYRANDPRVLSAKQYLLDDARTALFEGLIERGHLSVINSQWDEVRGAFMAGSTTIRDLSRRGLANPELNNVEYNRRTIELHEELFIEEMKRAGNLTPDKALLRISPYPQTMDQDLARELGYIPDRKKYMIRWVEIDEFGERRTKQLSMSSSNDARLSQVLEQLGVEAADLGFSSEGILMTPIILNKTDYPNGPADIAKLIDNGEYFLGGAPKVGEDYEDIERNSRRRELQLGQQYNNFAVDLVKLAAQISDKQLTMEEGSQAYRLALHKMIHDIAKVEPELAREVIGDVAANKYIQANNIGNNDVANNLRREAMAQSQPIYVCGMVLTGSKNGIAENSLLYCPEFKVGQTVICPHCKSRQVIKSDNLKPDKLYCDNEYCQLAKVSRRTKSKSSRIWFGQNKAKNKKPKSKSKLSSKASTSSGWFSW